MKKILLVILVIALFVGTFGFAMAKSGNDNGARVEKYDSDNDEDGSQRLLSRIFRNKSGTIVVNPNGNVTLDRGVISAISGDKITINIQGLLFTAQKTDTTKINYPKSQFPSGFTWSNLKINDIVKIKGKLDPPRPGLIFIKTLTLQKPYAIPTSSPTPTPSST